MTVRTSPASASSARRSERRIDVLLAQYVRELSTRETVRERRRARPSAAVGAERV